MKGIHLDKIKSNINSMIEQNSKLYNICFVD